MKKVQSIRKPVDQLTTAVVQPTTTPSPLLSPITPKPLEEFESNHLRHLIGLRSQLEGIIGAYIGSLLVPRGLKPDEWAVTLSDFKTIIPAPPKPPAAPNPNPPPTT